MLDFHERIHQESARLGDERCRTADETQSRALNALRGSLNEFLQTPLRADKDEIQRAILASFRHMLDSAFVRQPPGVTYSIEGEVISLPHGQHPLRKLGLNGSRYLADLGFSAARKSGAMFESVFIVRGGENLDVLEHIVRDVLGIYATTHGKHLREFSNYSYCLYNVVHGDIAGLAGGHGPQFLATFFFAKPGPEIIKYAPFRNALGSLIEVMQKEMDLRGASLWQRKLGLGTGVEFALRIGLQEELQIEDVANWLAGYSENPVVHRALAVDARLVLKRILLLQRPPTPVL
jgi:hypothetical protein